METANKQLAAKECEGTEDNRKTISQLLTQSECFLQKIPRMDFKRVLVVYDHFEAAQTQLVQCRVIMIDYTASADENVLLFFQWIMFNWLIMTALLQWIVFKRLKRQPKLS